jgi:hypothetical protein
VRAAGVEPAKAGLEDRVPSSRRARVAPAVGIEPTKSCLGEPLGGVEPPSLDYETSASPLTLRGQRARPATARSPIVWFTTRVRSVSRRGPPAHEHRARVELASPVWKTGSWPLGQRCEESVVLRKRERPGGVEPPPPTWRAGGSAETGRVELPGPWPARLARECAKPTRTSSPRRKAEGSNLTGSAPRPGLSGPVAGRSAAPSSYASICVRCSRLESNQHLLGFNQAPSPDRLREQGRGRGGARPRASSTIRLSESSRGSGTRNRTSINGVKIRRPAISRSPSSHLSSFRDQDSNLDICVQSAAACR